MKVEKDSNKPQQTTTSKNFRRLVWVAYAKLCTWFIPDKLLSLFIASLSTKGTLLNLFAFLPSPSSL